MEEMFTINLGLTRSLCGSINKPISVEYQNKNQTLAVSLSGCLYCDIQTCVIIRRNCESFVNNHKIK